jgi:pyruvate dehydrogenase E1 component
MASFLAAGTAYANYGLPMIPFYIFYSIFGFQRVGDMIWSCGDMMCKGFLLGGTSGRTTLNGEGLQHQDGHSHLVASTIPNLKSYDPAFAFEIALIVRDGIRRMYAEQEDVFYYLTVTNQNYAQPAMPDGVEAGVLAGMYCFQRDDAAVVNLFGSGAIMTEVLAAAALLRERGLPSNVWSVTSYNELSRQGLAAERRALLAGDNASEQPLVSRLLAAEQGVFVAASDYLKALPLAIGRWVPGPYTVLGTDGFGLSEGRPELRDHFEVSAGWIAYAALATRARHGNGDFSGARALAAELNLDLAKADPARA